MKAYEAGEMQTVVAETDAILAQDSDLPAALYLRGSAFWQLKRFADAESDLRAALAGDPELDQIHAIFGTVLIERGRELGATDRDGSKQAFNEAVEVLRGQIQRTPDDLATVTNLAVALESASRVDELGPVLERWLELEPADFEVATKLARYYASSDRVDEAVGLVDRLGLKGVGAANLLYDIAVSHYNAGELESAQLFADKVLAAHPDHVDVLRLRGYLQMQAGDQAAALQSFKDFVARADEANSQAERELIQMLQKSGS